MLSTIPFSGFYESRHSESLEWALEMLFSDDNGDAIPGLLEEAFWRVDWAKVHLAYAQMYCDQFTEAAQIKVVFESLQSPREYNFTTDRIFVHIDLAEVERLLTSVDRDIMKDLAEQRFTSRSGFVSFYDPDYTTWGPVEDWDHNQVGTLVEAFALMYIDDEFALVEDANCNGWLDEMICCSCDLSDLFDKREEATCEKK